MPLESSNLSNVGSRRIACHSCRVRKVKCDGAKPICSLCAVSGFSCEYQTPAPKITLETATNSLIDRLDKLQKTVDELKQTSSIQRHDSNSSLGAQQQQREDAFPLSSLTMSNLVSETSKDYLTIPAQTTSADAVLLWDVFEGKYSKNLLVEAMFEENSVDAASLPKPPVADKAEEETTSESIKDEDIPALVAEFLQNVHTKNPVLDVELLAEYSYSFAKLNFGWDGWSCLVLIACALGCIAKGFDRALAMQPAANFVDPEAEHQTSQELFGKDIERSRMFFRLACQRIGGLGSTVVGAQCYFFAGVYLMYTFKPLSAWQYFLHSSLLYDLNLKTVYGILNLDQGVTQVSIRNLAKMEEQRKRVEQSMYWSCFKSECEFRVELPLPQSHISTFHHPDLFPTPPSRSEVRNTNGKMEKPNRKQRPPAKRARLQENENIRWDLISQNESWYYYLTEIALRRIGNQIINTFFCHEPRWWLDLSPLIPIAKEFDAQLSSWSNHLPPAMRHYETTLAIRAPALQWSDRGSENFVSQELSWAIGNRVLELRSWLYQPFLFYIAHAQNSLNHTIRAQSSNGISGNPLSSGDQAALQAMVFSGVECNLKILDVRSLKHRHHGLWFDLRSLVCASFVLLALVASGHENSIPGGAETLWGSQPPDAPCHQIGGKIGNVLRQLSFWAPECPSLNRHNEFLHTLTRQVYFDLHSRNSQ